MFVRSTKHATHLLRSSLAVVALAATASCATATEADVDDVEGVGSTESALSTSPERAVVAKLGRPSRFLFGLGNDVGAAEGWDPNRAHAFTLGPKVDIHYMYLSGLPGEGGWTEWNSPSGYYITKHGEAAKARGVVPMFTLYQAAAWGENNLGAFNNWSYMNKYWRGVRTMFERLNALGVPSIVHVEPDFWGYAQKRGDDPWAVPVQVTSHVPECKDLPNNVAGFGKCIVRLSRRISPKVVIGLSASTFACPYKNGKPDAARTGAYLNKVGGAEADIVIVETLDRDAGCFERSVDPNCKRSGSFYWNDTSYRDHMAWARGIRQSTGKPLLWWQMPLGVPNTWAGSANAYRDNRVQYVFSRPWEFAQAGGIGAVFGTGAPNQTTAKTDGGQFKNALTKYLSYGGNGLN